jgi:hypothetical protein
MLRAKKQRSVADSSRVAPSRRTDRQAWVVWRAGAYTLASKCNGGVTMGGHGGTSPRIDNGTIQPRLATLGIPGEFMNTRPRSNRRDVLSLRLAGERASRQGFSERSLERLETENAQLRGCLVDLMLRIQALRDSGRTLKPSYSSHSRSVISLAAARLTRRWPSA